MRKGLKAFCAWLPLILLLLIPIVCGLCALHHRDTTPAMERDTVTIIVRDTVTIVKPQPIVVSSAGLQRVTLPLWRDSQTADLSADLSAGLQVDLQVDSATVALPIERRVYADSTYRAVVSGAFISLDSISVYPRREIQRITIRERPRRWGLGISIGYGITSHGLQPFVGVGVSYRVWGW